MSTLDMNEYLVEIESKGKNKVFVPVASIEKGSLINTFERLSEIEKVVLPKGLKAIGKNVFAYCFDLKEITILDGVTSIGKGAFFCCQSLKKIIIPDSVVNIDCEAFALCNNLEEIILPKKITRIGKNTFKSCSKLENITIPSDVTSIDDFAFHDCINLNEVTIMNPKCDIGINAFLNCKKLKWMYMNEDGSIQLCEERKKITSEYPLEFNIENKEHENFLNLNYRTNCLETYKMMNQGLIDHMPQNYILKGIPSAKMKNYFINGNDKRWEDLIDKLTIKLEINKLEDNERIKLLTSFATLYYFSGGFSENEEDSKEAYENTLRTYTKFRIKRN